MPCLEELKARGTTWNAQWKGLTGHLFGIEKKCVGKILWMHPSLGPGPCSTNRKMYKNTGLEQIKTSQKYPTHQQLYAKKHIGVLNTTSSICSVASRQKVFVMPSATQPLLYHAKNGRGESLDSNTSLNVLLSNLRHYIGEKNLLFTPTSVRRCKRNACGAPGPNIPLTWTGTAAVWNPRLGGGNGEQHNIKQYWTIMHQCSTSNESNAILHNRFKHAKHEVKLPIPGLINDDNSSFFLKKFCFIQESLNATFYVCWVL